jgi:hypothetical protein
MSPTVTKWFFASILPRVENPLSESIGLGFPFALAGAGGVLGGVVHAKASPAMRDRAIIQGGLVGFSFGVAVYLLALAVQLGFEL